MNKGSDPFSTPLKSSGDRSAWFEQLNPSLDSFPPLVRPPSETNGRKLYNFIESNQDIVSVPLDSSISSLTLPFPTPVPDKSKKKMKSIKALRTTTGTSQPPTLDDIHLSTQRSFSFESSVPILSVDTHSHQQLKARQVGLESQSLDNSRHSLPSSCNSGTSSRGQVSRKFSKNSSRPRGVRSVGDGLMGESTRSLRLTNPKPQLTRRFSNPDMSSKKMEFLTLPQMQSLTLPQGHLGVVFKNQDNMTVVGSLKEDSCLLGHVRVGMVVDTLCLPDDGVELRGLDAKELCKALNSSTSMEGRVLHLKSPFSPTNRLPRRAATKVYLPTEGDATALGLKISGEPARIKHVAKSSPLYRKVFPGQRILLIELNDGTCYMKLQSFELIQILQESSGNEGRFMVLKNLLQRKKKKATTKAGGELVDDSSRRSLGSVNSFSSLRRNFSISRHNTLAESSSVSSAKGRSMSVSRMDSMRQQNASVRQLSARPGYATYPRSVLVDLPPSQLGVIFQNENDVTTILCMREDSPMLNDFICGMVVDTLFLPGGNELRGLDRSELCKALNSTCEFRGRKLLLKSPLKKDLPKVASTKINLAAMGDCKDWGIEFHGHPAFVKSVAPTSPLVGMIIPGQEVLSLGMADGTEFMMSSSEELKSLLYEPSNMGPSFMIFKNLKQREVKPEMTVTRIQSSRSSMSSSSFSLRNVFSRTRSSGGMGSPLDRRSNSFSGDKSRSDSTHPKESSIDDTSATLYKKLVIPPNENCSRQDTKKKSKKKKRHHSRPSKSKNPFDPSSEGKRSSREDGYFGGIEGSSQTQTVVTGSTT